MTYISTTENVTRIVLHTFRTHCIRAYIENSFEDTAVDAIYFVLAAPDIVFFDNVLVDVVHVNYDSGEKKEEVIANKIAEWLANNTDKADYLNLIKIKRFDDIGVSLITFVVA